MLIANETFDFVMKSAFNGVIVSLLLFEAPYASRLSTLYSYSTFP